MERTITFTMEDALISPMGLAVLAGAGLVKSTTQVLHFTERVVVKEGGTVSLSYSASEDHPIYYAIVEDDGSLPDTLTKVEDATSIKGTAGQTIFVDYYAEKADSLLIDIEPGKFSGNFYLEAATLFRDVDGKDHAAEFIIPNCRVQSNFTFTMAATGDPSTFTFTMDAFPGYTAYDKTKKVLCAIQVLDDSEVSNP